MNYNPTTYPINPRGQREYKISVIKEIFQQLKFISDKLRPLARYYPEGYVRIVMNARKTRGRLIWGNIFDELYGMADWRLSELNKSLEMDVDKKARERQQKVA